VVLLFLEFIGTQELLLIMVAALILFGPRKLPELGRAIGKSLGEFKRASEDFKRTWEAEVEAEQFERDKRTERAALEENTIARTNQRVDSDGFSLDSNSNSDNQDELEETDSSSNNNTPAEPIRKHELL
jgi:TatA/E family protein of Tat protein translocase